MSESIEALTGKSREAILDDLLDSGRSVTPVEYIARTEISRLTARIAELEKALKPFVDEFKACRDSYIRRYPRHPAVGADNFDKMPDDWPMATSDFSMGVFRFARTTLEASERGGGE